MHAFPIVITGHVDHGKSTLIGRLLYDTGTLSRDRFEEMRQSSHATGRTDQFAFVLDAFEEERSRGITIDTAQIFFTSAKRPYIIIDAPGHREFIRNMLTGASLASAAILLLDAVEGIQEQTKRHIWLLNMVGIRTICVAINKLDTVGYDEGLYLRLSGEITTLFSEMKLTAPLTIIPISALEGENVATRSKVITWYHGPSLLEIFDGLELDPPEVRPLRFPIQDCYHATAKTPSTLVGRIETGTLSAGMKCTMLPENRSVVIDSIRTFPPSEKSNACCGEAVGILLAGDHQVTRGSILAAGDMPMVDTNFSINLFWFFDSYISGDPVVIRCATQEVTGRIVLEHVYDPADPDTLEQQPDQILNGEVAMATLTTDAPLVVDFANIVPELGRIVINYKGQPAGAGLIV